MIFSKKAVLGQLMGFVLAFLGIVLIWLFIRVGFAAQMSQSELKNVNIIAEDMPHSVVCDYALLNFLRSEGNNSLSPAEMLSTSITDFKSYADYWFDIQYKRGNMRKRGFQMEVMQNQIPAITTFSQKFVPREEFSCIQTVPAIKGNYDVKLWLDY